MSLQNDVRKLEKALDYNGCANCKHQINPLRMCEWGEQQIAVYLICPKWEHKRKERLND